MNLNTYLFFDGNCREAFEFYQSVFGGDFSAFMTYGDGPEEMQIPDDHKNQIMHVSLPVGTTTLMGSDRWVGNSHPFNAGNNFGIAIGLQDKERSDELFARLSEGGEVTMPMETVFWGDYFGSLKDRFGVEWMISCELPAK